MSGRVISWTLGRRDDRTAKSLIDEIGTRDLTFITDDWEGFHRLIPEHQLFTGKDLTYPIEQDITPTWKQMTLRGVGDFSFLEV
ncbi:hypothetical protein [Candidatus Bealeia paramacronuclearis]|uniref:hypothetical protein n=1 Tax=Candidatus Bealeia paramacronuclearis TaxID=1921001 RepID=UPI0039C31692